MKQKQVTFLLILSATTLLIGYLFCRKDPNDVVIKITSETKAFTQNVYPPGPDVYALGHYRTGFADDTIMLDGFKIPPDKIKFSSKPIDFYGQDPIKFSYDPYRAKKVKLKIVYNFCR